jgi:hypothetical protein
MAENDSIEPVTQAIGSAVPSFAPPEDVVDGYVVYIADSAIGYSTGTDIGTPRGWPATRSTI